MNKDPIVKTLIEIERVDSSIQEIQNDSQKIVEAINDLDQTKASKRELEIAIEGVQTIKGDRGFKGEKGADGKDGKDYILTESDKDEIASKVEVPVVEKIIEKTEVIKEQPIEVENKDTPDQVIEKIHKSKKLIKKEKIEGLEDIERKADLALNRPIMGVGGGSSGIREVRAGSGISVSNVNEIITISAHSSTTDHNALSNRSAENSHPASAISYDNSTSGLTADDVQEAIDELTSSSGGAEDGIGFDIDGFGIVPSTTVIGSYVAKKAGTITGWKIIESNSVSSSIVLTVKKNGTAISGIEKPTLSSATSNEDLTLTTWTTSIAKGDIISVSIDSVSVGTKFFLQIYYS